MRLLLDTHIALWTAIDSPRLPQTVRALVSSPDATLFVSMASVWEVGIKFARRRGRPDDMPISAANLLRLLEGARCELLRIEPPHIVELEQLPPLHGDPFDRLLIAQARAEPLRFVTVDAALGAYGARVEVY